MKFVAFDLDDTIYKEEEYVESAFHAIAKSLPTDIHAFDVLYKARKNGDNAFDTLQKVYPQLSISAALNTYRFHKPNLTLLDSNKKLLELLSSKGVKLALITDGRSISQRNKIEALGLSKWIEDKDILISEEFGSEKTDIRNFSYFCNKYPNCEEYFYIGDNPKKDFLYPNQLGWKTIQLDDNGLNIHSQKIELDNKYKAKYHITNLIDAGSIILGNSY